MRLTRRVKSLETKAASSTGCPVCRGEGWPAVMVANAPPGSMPPGWRTGCRMCGRITTDQITWIGIGDNPTARQVRDFREAI